jgi:ribosomal protein S18 acetylase RimI-like enzyme
MTRATGITVRPLTAARWDDLEALFEARGCGVARQCWCMAYRRTGSDKPPAKTTRARWNRAQLKALADSREPPGLIGYRGKVPVGWISLGPRSAFERLKRSPVMKAVDEQPVWSIVCFVVPPEYRGQGIARALLDGAVTYARKRGVTILEAYPVDKPGRSSDEAMWFGAKSMYDDAGFREVARRRPHRPVVRLQTRLSARGAPRPPAERIPTRNR